MTPLEELRLALTTIDRENAEATPGPWIPAPWHDRTIIPKPWADWDGGEGSKPDFPTNAMAVTNPFDVTLIVSAVAVYRGVVRDVIASAIDNYRVIWWHGIEYSVEPALRLARDINSRTEGARK